MKKALIYSLSLALLLSLAACHKPQADQQDTNQPDPAAVSTPADVSTPEPEPTTLEPATTPEPEKITTPEPVAPEPEPEQTPPAPVETEETQPTEPVQQPKPTTKPTPANPDPDTGEITYINPNQVDDGSTGITTGAGGHQITQEELTQGIDPNQNPWDVQGEMYYGGQQEDQSGGTGTQTQQPSKPSSGGKDIYGGFPTYKEYIDDICKQRPDKTRAEIEAAFPDLATGHTDEAAANQDAAAGLFNH